MPAVGGVARRATAIERIREQSENVLLVDAGDSLANDQDPARSTQGRTSVEAMNRMGYDAAALGPLDIALGPEILRDRGKEARHPFLSTNAYDRNAGERVAEPYKTVQIGGRDVLLIGVTGSGSTDRIEVRDPIASLRDLLRELPDRHDIVIVLSNAGEEVDAQIAREFPRVDVIVAGGDGSYRDPDELKAGLASRFYADMTAPGHAGRHIGSAELRFDSGGQLAEQSWRRIKLGPEIPGDPEMLEWVVQAKASG
jgi:2',3'-cyclic-nucleotide 2'-phosphodiesterase (5'-nucleotidase family)